MFDNKVKRLLRKAVRLMNVHKVDAFARRADLARNIAEKSIDGKVALVVWQMDCDCASWTTASVVNANVTTINAHLERIYDGAEGPINWHIDRPNVKVDRNVRDHALEAFEDGHAHSVTY